MLPMIVILQGITFKTITLPVHNIMLRTSGGIGWYGVFFIAEFTLIERGWNEIYGTWNSNYNNNNDNDNEYGYFSNVT